jgi:hypothetical protein
MPNVPVTVYVVVIVGLAATVEPDVEDKPVAGDQLYVVAPVAVNVLELPAQIVALGVIVIVTGVTIIVVASVAVHPFESVPVKEYTVVDVGQTVGDKVDPPVIAVVGLQVYDATGIEFVTLF